MAGASHYHTLQVGTTATTDEIRKAYHRLARAHHPDRFINPDEKNNAEQLFATFTEAFNVLSNPERRRQYDVKQRAAASGETSPQHEAKNYYRAGTAKLAEGHAKDAIRLFQAAVHLDPAPGTYYASYARALEADSAFGEAARQWDEAIKREPFNASYCRMAGQCLEKAGMKIRARKMYESALKVDRTDARSAEALKRLGGDDENKAGVLGGLFKRT